MKSIAYNLGTRLRDMRDTISHGSYCSFRDKVTVKFVARSDDILIYAKRSAMLQRCFVDATLSSVFVLD